MPRALLPLVPARRTIDAAPDPAAPGAADRRDRRESATTFVAAGLLVATAAIAFPLAHLRVLTSWRFAAAVGLVGLLAAASLACVLLHHRACAGLRMARRIVEHSPVILFRLGVSDERHVEYVSDTITRYGYEPAELLETPGFWHRMIHADDRGTIAQDEADLLAGRVERRTHDFRLRDARGRLRWLHGSLRVSRNADGVPIALEGVAVESTDRRLAEDALRRTLARTQRQLVAVGEVGQLEGLTSGDVVGVARRVTELAARATGCERVNVWLFNDDETELRCIDGFEASLERHSSGMVLREPDFRDEFQVLKSARYVDASDPLTDPRTAGYVNSYLRPLGITSMLDAVIRVSDRNLGLICFEHVSQTHYWQQDEIAFACQLADKIGLALLARERRRDARTLSFANALLTTQMETSPDGILVVDPSRRVVSFNQRFLQTWKLDAAAVADGSDEALLAAAAQSLVEPERFLERVDRLYEQPDAEARDELETRDGRFIERHTAPLRLATGESLGRVWFFRDITDRRRAEAAVRHTATHDALTGLANRAVFLRQVEQAIVHARRSGRSFALLSLDLDHFKDVNDTLGHPAGDALLRLVGERLRRTCRAGDTIARLGGDEFAILAADLADPTDASVLAAAVIAALREPFALTAGEVRTGASIGIATFVGADDPADASGLLAHADHALYRAKADGRGAWRFFTEAMDHDVRTRVTLGNELREALASSQLFVVYQPQVHLETGRVSAVEALVRWAHPRLGVVGPATFIPVAERTGLVAAIGQWVLTEACRQARAWLDEGLSLNLAVNLSAVQFKAPLDLERDVLAALAASGLPPERLELELTETAMMVASREENDVLRRLRERGVRLAIDDFGTGYSSLDYLRRYPVDRIKIPHAFVAHVGTTGETAAIVRAILSLARELGIGPIAEGVETEAQARLLRAWGCPEVQGYLYSEALTSDALVSWLERHRTTRTIGPDDAALSTGADALASIA